MGDGWAQKCVHHPPCVNCIYCKSQAGKLDKVPESQGKPRFAMSIVYGGWPTELGTNLCFEEKIRQVEGQALAHQGQGPLPLASSSGVLFKETMVNSDWVSSVPLFLSSFIFASRLFLFVSLNCYNKMGYFGFPQRRPVDLCSVPGSRRDAKISETQRWILRQMILS